MKEKYQLKINKLEISLLGARCGDIAIPREEIERIRYEITSLKKDYERETKEVYKN